MVKELIKCVSYFYGGKTRMGWKIHGKLKISMPDDNAPTNKKIMTTMDARICQFFFRIVGTNS